MPTKQLLGLPTHFDLSMIYLRYLNLTVCSHINKCYNPEDCPFFLELFLSIGKVVSVKV